MTISQHFDTEQDKAAKKANVGRITIDLCAETMAFRRERQQEQSLVRHAGDREGRISF